MKTTLLLATLLPATFFAAGEETNKSLASDSIWVRAKEAGYRMTDDGITGAVSAELKATALPESIFTKLKTQKEWDEFITRYTKIDTSAAKPEFDYKLVFSPADLTPDFDSEVVWVISVDKDQQGLGHFVGMEVLEDGGRIKVFAFFTGKPDESVAGHLYMVSIPRNLADHPVEFSRAYQGWGRICSQFLPAITSTDAARNQPKNPEQGGSGQPATRSESK